MSKYLCEECQWNDNGRCKVKQFSGLKRIKMKECDKYKAADTEEDEYLNKLLKAIDKQLDKFGDQFENEEALPNDLLYDAMKIIYLQKEAIDTLLEKTR